MNIQNNCSPNFGSAYITQRGKEHLAKKSVSDMEETLAYLDEAEDSKFYDLVYDVPKDSYGAIYLQNKETKERFTIDNPSRSTIYYDSLTCNVRSPEGKVYPKEFKLTREECEKLEKAHFGGVGTYMPQMNVDLFKAIEATNTYNSLINKLDNYKIYD